VLAALRRLADFSGARVVEIGCGDGRLTLGVAEQAASVFASDPDEEAVARARGALGELLVAAGAVATVRTLRLPTLHDVEAAGLGDEVEDIYRRLGGRQAGPRFQLGGWDMEIDGIAVELDEDRHFNRYRRQTLDSPLHERLTFPLALYTRVCERHEAECLRAGSWGKRWSQPRAAVEFGEAGEEGRLDGAGSPRWKQRAFYDFVKDK